MNALFTALISPLGTALMLAVVALILSVRAWRRASRALALFAFAWLWIWSTPVANLHLRAHLERPFPPIALRDLPAAQAIVVLGGTMSPPTVGRPWPDLSAAADRVWHAARLFHAGKAPLVVLSGGSDLSLSLVPEAQAMSSFIQDLGVSSAALLLEPDSRSTRDNARFTAQLLRDRKLDHVLLVTSALHMGRAVAHFRAQGLTVVPAATDHSPLAAPGVLAWWPDPGALEGSSRAIKEVIGQWVLSIAGAD